MYKKYSADSSSMILINRFFTCLYGKKKKFEMDNSNEFIYFKISKTTNTHIYLNFR